MLSPCDIPNGLMLVWMHCYVDLHELVPRLPDHFRVWGMEAPVVCELGEVGKVTLFYIGGVAGLKRSQIAVDRELTLDSWVLSGRIGLIEIINVLHECCSKRLEYDGRVRSDQNCDRPHASSTPRRPGSIHGDIGRKCDSQPPVPCRALHPRHRIKQRLHTPITSIHRSHALNIMIPDLLKQLHQQRFC
jgi:hypothetical protein